MNNSRGKRSSREKSRSQSASKRTSARTPKKTSLPLDPLTAVSAVDGRYRSTAGDLAQYFSEFALQRNRLIVECAYLIALSKTRGSGVRRLSPAEESLLKKLAEISLEDGQVIKAIEREGYEGILATNHDVKAIEYFIKGKLAGTTLEDVSERVHFALTSEDINSVAHALSLRDALEAVILPAVSAACAELLGLAQRHAKTAMLARTHGQSASPTTFGKEMRVFAARLERQFKGLMQSTIQVKWGGATGNYNAHTVALPELNWLGFAQKFIDGFNSDAGAKKHVIKLELNPVTTQIEPHDSYAELFDAMRRINTILIGCSQDLWRYISDGWVTQKPKAGEIGSSAMPHKVNPIDFENAEGNFGVANALFEHLSRKLPISRLQRDLSDSTVERTFGTAFAHALIGYRSLMRGFSKIVPNKAAMLEALQAHPEVLAEAIQTALRIEGVPVPYEQLKELTRGKQVTLADFADFIDGLDISPDVKKRLKKLRPETYLGIAQELSTRG